VKTKPTGKPLIALTPGEPGGVGPEITARLFAQFRPTKSVAVVVGAYPVLEPWLDRYRVGAAVIRTRTRRPEVADIVTDAGQVLTAIRRGPGHPRILVLDTGCRERYGVGRDSRGGGKHSGFALEVVCALIRGGVLEGIVTGPISKHALRLGGYAFNGHTEFFSRYFNAPDCQMMMVYRTLRVVPLTRHIPLRSVARALSAVKILRGLRVVNDALIRDFGVSRPHLALSALNPHAGEEGVLGKEEAEVIGPALRRARALGIRVTGPVPGDTLFQHAQSGTFDAFITMYHDQGLIPFKMTSMRRGVNVTLGLPAVRTSVDHGVAYDIAEKGKASPESLEAAYRLAEALVHRRRAQKVWRWTR
jgi:4-hydroxythreonine-4-phosphate dehydrogenase